MILLDTRIKIRFKINVNVNTLKATFTFKNISTVFKIFVATIAEYCIGQIRSKVSECGNITGSGTISAVHDAALQCAVQALQ